jgi:hypothetical protein
MSRFRVTALILAVLLAVASISIHPRRTYQVVDREGRPHLAYIVYRYAGSRPNFVHPVSYTALDRTLARGADDGRVTLPFRILPHLPFPVKTHPELYVDMIYAPALHNALGGAADAGLSRPDVFEFDADRRVVSLADLTDRPDLWQSTLYELSSLIRDFVFDSPDHARSLRDRDPQTADLALELITHFRHEYEAFLARHDETARPMPEEPPFVRAEDRQRWIETTRKRLEREPTWGASIRSMFRDDIAWLREHEAALR